MARIDVPAGDGLEVGRALGLVPHFAVLAVEYERAVARSPLDRRLHELVRLRIAQINECVVCLAWRNDWGATEAELASVADYATSPLFSAADRVALEYAERFCLDSARIPDTLLDRLQEHLGPAAVVDLTLVIGKYLAMGRFMQVLGLDQACVLSYADDGELVAASSVSGTRSTGARQTVAQPGSDLTLPIV